MNWVLKKRSIWFHIIITYFTGGIWLIIYFYYKNKHNKRKNSNDTLVNDDIYGKNYESTIVVELLGNQAFEKENFTWKCYKGNTLSNYVIFDVETTGLDPIYDRITEFSLLKYVDNKLVDTFAELVNPNKFIPQVVVSKTGITNEMVKDKNDISTYIDKIFDFIGDNVIVGHNIEFDIKFLSKESIRCNKKYEGKVIKYIDTLQLSKLLIRGVENYKLDTLKQYLNINIQTHRTFNDCLVENELYQYCKTEIDENIEIRKISIEKKMADLNENERIFIENIKSKVKQLDDKLEVDIDFKSGDIINFCVNEMQIGRVKLRGKKTCIQVITDSDVHWIENVNLEEAMLLSDKWIKYLKKYIK